MCPEWVTAVKQLKSSILYDNVTTVEWQFRRSLELHCHLTYSPFCFSSSTLGVSSMLSFFYLCVWRFGVAVYVEDIFQVDSLQWMSTMYEKCDSSVKEKEEKRTEKQGGGDETPTARSIGRRTTRRGLSRNTVARHNFICGVLWPLTCAIMCLSVAMQLWKSHRKSRRKCHFDKLLMWSSQEERPRSPARVMTC